MANQHYDPFPGEEDYRPNMIADDDVRNERSRFIALTYMHLAGAIFTFIAIETLLMVSGAATWLAQTLLASGFGWLLALGAFMGVSYVADRWARSAESKPMQYAGLGLYVLAEAIIIAPLLVIATLIAQEKGLGSFDLIWQAGLATLLLTGALTGVVFATRKDFSFLRGVLMFGGIAAMGIIVVSLIFGFSLGLFFSWAMVFLAGGYILYQTSAIRKHYATHQYVAAALSLFSSIALLFWYVLRIFMSRD